MYWRNADKHLDEVDEWTWQRHVKRISVGLVAILGGGRRQGQMRETGGNGHGFEVVS